MKKSLIILTALTMLAVSSCRKIEMDGGTTTVVPGPLIGLNKLKCFNKNLKWMILVLYISSTLKK
jgi:hypothetical protein